MSHRGQGEILCVEPRIVPSCFFPNLYWQTNNTSSKIALSECDEMISLMMKVISDLAKLNLTDAEYALLSAALLMSNSEFMLTIIL